jgi:hypothetical protein
MRSSSVPQATCGDRIQLLWEKDEPNKDQLRRFLEDEAELSV